MFTVTYTRKTTIKKQTFIFWHTAGFNDNISFQILELDLHIVIVDFTLDTYCTISTSIILIRNTVDCVYVYKPRGLWCALLYTFRSQNNCNCLYSRKNSYKIYRMLSKMIITTFCYKKFLAIWTILCVFWGTCECFLLSAVRGALLYCRTSSLSRNKEKKKKTKQKVAITTLILLLWKG